MGNNMFAYCNNNPVIYIVSNGCDAIILYDKDALGHIGIMLQDSDGKWYHFYWGTRGGITGLLDRVQCAFLVSVPQYSWCVEYCEETTSLQSINASNQYSGEYEEMHYLDGDFSECVDDIMSPDGEYNLYTNNCSQVSLGILATADTEYKTMLSQASKYVIPMNANSYITRNIGRYRTRYKISFGARGHDTLHLAD